MRRSRALSCALLLALLVAGFEGGAAQASPDTTGNLPHAATPATTTTLPVQYDPVADYEAQTGCDATPKPGTRALADLIRKTYGRNQSIGISRGCSVGGTSEHKEGRALDWMTSARNRQGLANAKAFLAWLLAPDAAGVPYANATRLGVMYVGWNDHYWASYATERGWAELKGCFSKPGRGYDTTCHRNHIHISLSWDGASGRTSFWDGTALTAFCPTAYSESAVVAAGRAAEVVAVPPVRVLSTRLGQGLVLGVNNNDWTGGTDGLADGLTGDPTDGLQPADLTLAPAPVPVPETAPEPVAVPAPAPTAPCRVHPGGWRGGGGILTKVTGQGGVPELDVAAVAVTVTALGSTAPATISVRSPGHAEGVPVIGVRMNGRGHGSAIVPVAADGTIALATSAGGVDLLVDVTGYYLVGDQPNVSATSYVK